ncbi:MAG: NAD(+) synthase [Alphaproteobacteria bacterium]|nr:NAD(+) synthase [Alphaproteobacteria bacterium]
MAKQKPTGADRFLCPFTHGFVRIAAAAPVVRLADPAANAVAILALAEGAQAQHAAVLLTPELGLTGYAVDDLFGQDALLDAVEAAIEMLRAASAQLSPILIVGAPLRLRSALYNCAVVIGGGRVLGVVPKSYLPNYREYYEKRHFATAFDAGADAIRLGGETAPFGANLIFSADDVREFCFHIEICEDLWAPSPPSTTGALAGATVLLNLSASNITIGKADERAALVDAQSRRCAAAYIYAAAGRGESTTDLAWDGQVIAYEMGEKLGESARFARTPDLLVVDVDVDRIAQERRRFATFHDGQGRARATCETFRTVPFSVNAPTVRTPLMRPVPRYPFVPDDAARLDRDCFEAYNIQVAGLAQRLEATGLKRAVIGVSGGLDSTHASIVIARAFDLIGLPRSNVIGVTMPGFATSDETRTNAWALMRALGFDARETSIEPLAQLMFQELGHPAGHGAPEYDITYENVQAGLRTDYLFRLANQEGGLVVGTGDLSELALGWCTYGVGDHMSHYNVNAGAPKTLIQHLIRWVISADLFDGATSDTLARVLDTVISPELVPTTGDAPQSTEDMIGPYALQDFNLFHLVRCGMPPSKVAYLALQAWGDAEKGLWPLNLEPDDKRAFSYEEIRRWLGVFLTRFFQTSQFKRSAVPNGPKITSGGALSPRGDWRAPSDASAAVWLAELDANAPRSL